MCREIGKGIHERIIMDKELLPEMVNQFINSCKSAALSTDVLAETLKMFPKVEKNKRRKQIIPMNKRRGYHTE